MVMLTQNRIAEVVREQVVLVWERAPGYHKDLASALVDIVSLQDQGFPVRTRRARVKRIIEGLGDRVLSQQESEQCS